MSKLSMFLLRTWIVENCSCMCGIDQFPNRIISWTEPGFGYITVSWRNCSNVYTKRKKIACSVLYQETILFLVRSKDT